MSRTDTKLLGRWGEKTAADFLIKRKYSITGLSYHSRFGEIDIIAENKKYVVFVEVKTRKSDAFAAPREFVDQGKQKRILSTAMEWLRENETDKQPRFDVIEIYAPDGAETVKPKIIHYENAFGAQDA